MQTINKCRICVNTEENDQFIPIFVSNSKVALRIYLISGVEVCAFNFDEGNVYFFYFTFLDHRE
jgi:hypothetical protein